MKRIDWRPWILRFGLVLVASTGPVAFPMAQMGYASLPMLARVLILPSVLFLALAWAVLRRGPAQLFARALLRGAIAGAVATLALEAFRYTGFRLGYMPGNLPRLMGVLLLNRFALGPSDLSDFAGFIYHFWNGAAFGIIFAMLSIGRSRWWAIPYGLAIGVGFMVSPVVQAMGIGYFGVDFGWQFSATVLLAHAAYGISLGSLVRSPHPSSQRLSTPQAIGIQP